MNEWRAVLAALLFLLFAFMFVCWMGSAPTFHFTQPAHSEEAAKCDYPESLITDALKDEPDRLVARLSGKTLESFLSKAQAAGYLSGSLPDVTALYIIRGKLLAGYTEAIDILFFISGDGCIVGKVYATASVVEKLFWTEGK